jgi:hypothetical protein
MALPKKHAKKGSQGQGADYETNNCIVHKFTSSGYVINMLNVLQFVNGNIISHFHFPCESEGGFVLAKIFLNKVIH